MISNDIAREEQKIIKREQKKENKEKKEKKTMIVKKDWKR